MPCHGRGADDDIKDVLAVIDWYEGADSVCNDAPPDHGTGLDSATVDEVLGYSWKTDLIEVVIGSGIGALRSTMSRASFRGARLWGDERTWWARE